MKKQKYLYYGIIAMLLGSLNPPTIKLATQHLSPTMFNVMRYAIASGIMLPLFWRDRGKISRRNLYYAALSGIGIAISSQCFATAIHMSSSAYASLLTLLNPIFLVILSAKITREKIKSTYLVGFSLAGLGALIIILAPALGGGATDISFYPVATGLLLIMAVAYPLATIFARKAHEARPKLPLTSVIFVQTFVTMSVGLAIAITTQTLSVPTSAALDPTTIWAVLFSAIGVNIFNRLLYVESYRQIGSVINGALWYLGVFVTLAVSVFVLGESISVVAIGGGIITLLGVILSESKIAKKLHFHHRLYEQH